VYPTVIGVCAVILIEWATRSENAVVKLGAIKPLRWLGIVSYAAYLWNLPITTWWNAATRGAPPLSNLAIIPLTIGAAVVSWFTVEALGRSLRRRFDTWQARRAAAASAEAS
jgi:peptidoglycan/LPS O-acetylase OafA/YrhL